MTALLSLGLLCGCEAANAPVDQADAAVGMPDASSSGSGGEQAKPDTGGTTPKGVDAGGEGSGGSSAPRPEGDAGPDGHVPEEMDAAMPDAMMPPEPDAAVPPSCTDGLQNGDETAMDCGGSCPNACATGLGCATGADCVSTVCEQGVCMAPATCTDGARNGDETAMDCGGSCPNACATGLGCATGADCVSTACDQGVCVAAPTCTDGIQNGDESDVDCGGSCPQGCGVGLACATGADCKSASCDQGLCAPGAVGQGCTQDSDCATNTCIAEDEPGGGYTRRCRVASCRNHRRDAAETGVDCGGPDCQPCKCTVNGESYHEGWVNALCRGCESQTSTTSWSPLLHAGCICYADCWSSCSYPCYGDITGQCYEPNPDPCMGKDAAECVATSYCTWN